MGSIGDCYDNPMIDSFWGRVQIERLNRKGWRTRIALTKSIFEYLETFHKRKRRHSALGMRAPTEFKLLHQSTQPVACNHVRRQRQTRGTSETPRFQGESIPCEPE